MPLKDLSEDPEAQEDEDESKEGQVLPCRSIGFTIQLGVRSTPPRKLRLTSNTLCVIMGGNRKKCVFTSEYQILSSKLSTLISFSIVSNIGILPKWLLILLGSTDILTTLLSVVVMRTNHKGLSLGPTVGRGNVALIPNTLYPPINNKRDNILLVTKKR